MSYQYPGTYPGGYPGGTTYPTQGVQALDNSPFPQTVRPATAPNQATGTGGVPQAPAYHGGQTASTAPSGYTQAPQTSQQAVPRAPQQPQAPASYTPTYSEGSPQQALVNYYQQYLGRTPSAAELQGYLQHGMTAQNVATYGQQIFGSPEAAAYRQSQAQAVGNAASGNGTYTDPRTGITYAYDARTQQWVVVQSQPNVTGAPTGATGGAPPNTAGYDTDGYAIPGYIAQGFGGVMPGWDATKWTDPLHQTPKYVVGRILSQFPSTPQGLQQAMALIQQAYPGAQLMGDDSLYIPGFSQPVDILRGASVGGRGWQWLSPQAAAAGQAGPLTEDPTLQALQLIAQQAQQFQLPQVQGAGGGGVSNAQYAALQKQIADLMAQFQQQQQDYLAQQSAAARTPNVTYY